MWLDKNIQKAPIDLKVGEQKGEQVAIFEDEIYCLCGLQSIFQLMLAQYKTLRI